MIALLRLSSEFTLKSDQVRKVFLKRLIKNIEDAFKSHQLNLKVKNNWCRVFVEFDDEAGIEILKRIYGLSSFSIIEHQCTSTFEAIVNEGYEFYRHRLQENKTFAVEARRVGKNFPFTSLDINMHLGGKLKDNRYKVSIKNPNIAIKVEIRPDVTYFFSESLRGAGGFPLGAGGKAMGLLSGGFDSPVAIWMMQRRGIEMNYILCNIGGQAYERSVLQIAKHLADRWSYGASPRLHVIDFEKVAEHLRQTVHPRYTQIILKRVFIYIANKLCQYYNADAIITGEAVGQVSSQTITNLRAIDSAAKFPILRPVVAMDKEDIIALAGKIGTEHFSAKIQEFCQLVPQKPATACSVERAEAEEAKLDFSIIDQAITDRTIHVLRDLNALDLIMPFITTDEIKEHDVLIDLREQHLHESDRIAQSINCEYLSLLQDFKKLDKSKRYVLYCPVGSQSSIVAEKMQQEGYLAYSFKGGIGQLKKYLQRSQP